MNVILKAFLFSFVILPSVIFGSVIDDGINGFSKAFESGDIESLETFFDINSRMSIETDNNIEVKNQVVTNSEEFRNKIKEILVYQPNRMVLKGISIKGNKIVFGGKNFNSTHNHWLLRELDYQVINGNFKITRVYLIDGM